MPQVPLPSGLDGISLRPLIEGQSPVATPPSYSESLFGRLHFGWSDLRAVRSGQWKFVEAPASELYDVRADPAERTNLLDRKRNTAATLARLLQELAAGRRRTIQGLVLRSTRSRPSGSRHWDTSPVALSSAPWPVRIPRPRSLGTWATSSSSPTASTPCRQDSSGNPSECSSVLFVSSRQATRCTSIWAARWRRAVPMTRRFDPSRRRADSALGQLWSTSMRRDRSRRCAGLPRRLRG